MTRRRFLTAATAVGAAAGIIAASVPFVRSLNPSGRAGNDLPRINVHEIERSSFRTIELRPSEVRQNAHSTTYIPGGVLLVVRDHGGRFHLFSMPTFDKKFLMPRTYWGQFEGLCDDFGPRQTDRVIAETTLLQCNDEGIEGHFASHWFWRLDGENVSGELPALWVIPFTHEGDNLVLYRRE